MKKLIVASVILLIGFHSFADFMTIRVHAGTQLAGTQDLTTTTTSSSGVGNGLSVGGEFAFTVLDAKNTSAGMDRELFVQLGGGGEYELSRTVSGLPGTFQCLPVYLLARLAAKVGSVTPYVLLRAGPGLWIGSSTYAGGAALSNGLYFDGGGGADFGLGVVALFGEITYALDTTSYTDASGNVAASYKRLEVAFGVSVSF